MQPEQDLVEEMQSTFGQFHTQERRNENKMEKVEHSDQDLSEANNSSFNQTFDSQQEQRKVLNLKQQKRIQHLQHEINCIQ